MKQLTRRQAIILGCWCVGVALCALGVVLWVLTFLQWLSPAGSFSWIPDSRLAILVTDSGIIFVIAFLYLQRGSKPLIELFHRPNI